MKVYVQINATALPGKSSEARKAALETVQYLNKNRDYVGNYEIVHSITGPNNQFCWLCHYQSMADYEKDAELRGSDPKWAEVFEKVNACVDVDHVTSQLLRVSE